MATRRMFRMARAMSPARSPRRRCSAANNGKMRLLDTMADRATASTMTMAVAAENPPTKTTAVRVDWPLLSGRASTSRSGLTWGANRPPAATRGRTARLVSSR
ncbi:hypothetical protein D3C80_1380670 [compost metagenome]